MSTLILREDDGSAIATGEVVVDTTNQDIKLNIRGTIVHVNQSANVELVKRLVATVLGYKNTVAGDKGIVAADKKIVTDTKTAIENLKSQIDGIKAALDKAYFVSATQPTSNVTKGDLWSDTTNSKIKWYDGSAWVSLDTYPTQAAAEVAKAKDWASGNGNIQGTSFKSARKYSEDAATTKQAVETTKTAIDTIKTDIDNKHTDVTTKATQVGQDTTTVGQDKAAVAQLKKDTQTLKDDVILLINAIAKRFFLNSNTTYVVRENTTQFDTQIPASGNITLSLVNGSTGNESILLVNNMLVGSGTLTVDSTSANIKPMAGGSNVSSFTITKADQTTWVVLAWNNTDSVWEMTKYALPQAASDTTKLNLDLGNINTAGKAVIDARAETVAKRVAHDQLRTQFGMQHFKGEDFNLVGVTGGKVTDVNFIHSEDFFVPNKIGGTVQFETPEAIKFYPHRTLGKAARLQINIGTNDELFYHVELNSSDPTKVDYISIRKQSDETEILQVSEVLAGDIVKGTIRDRNIPIGNQSDGTNTFTHVYALNMIVKAEIFGNPAKERAQVQLKDMRSSGVPLPFMYEYSPQFNRPIDLSFFKISPPDTLLGLAAPTRYISDHVKSTQVTWAARENGYFPSNNLQYTVVGTGWETIYEVASGDKNSNEKPNAGRVTLASGKKMGHGKAYKILITKSSLAAEYAHIPAGSLDIAGATYTIDIVKSSSDKVAIGLTRESDTQIAVSYGSSNTGYGVYEIESYDEYAHRCDTRNIVKYPVVDVENSLFTRTGIPTKDDSADYIWRSLNESTGAISSPFDKSGSFTPTSFEKIYEASSYINLKQSYKLADGKAFKQFCDPSDFVLVRYWKSDGSFKESLLNVGQPFADGGTIHLNGDGHFTLSLYVDGNKFYQLTDPNGYRVYQIYKVRFGSYKIDDLVINDRVLLAEKPVDTMSHQLAVDPNTFTVLGDIAGGSTGETTSIIDTPHALSTGDIVAKGKLYTYNGAKKLAIKGQSSFGTNTWGNPANFVALGANYLSDLLDVNNIVPSAANVGDVLGIVENSDGTKAVDVFEVQSGYNSIISTQSNAIYADKSDGSKPILRTGYWYGEPEGTLSSATFNGGLSYSATVNGGFGDQNIQSGKKGFYSSTPDWEITFNKPVPMQGLLTSPNYGVGSHHHPNRMRLSYYDKGSWVDLFGFGSLDRRVDNRQEYTKWRVSFRGASSATGLSKVAFYIANAGGFTTQPFKQDAGGTARTITITNANTHNPKTDGLIANNSSKPNIVVDAGQQIVKTVFDGDKFIPTETTVNAGDIISQTLTTNQAVWYHLK